MPISVSNLVAVPTALSAGANNVTVTYSGFVVATADNNVAISATSNTADVRVTSVTPALATFPLVIGPLQLSLQLNVVSPGGGTLNATVTVTFTTATGIAINKNLVLLY